MDKWGGNTDDECFELMQQAVDVGVDMISVTVGWQEAPESSIGRDIAPGYWNHLSERAKKMFPNTLITFGNRLPDPRMAHECLRDGIFDYREVCRPLLADPELIHEAAEDRLDEVRCCIGSLNCLSRLFRDLPCTCTMNPALGHEVEPEYQVTRAAVKKKVMVIGAGPAGMECAITATKRGHDVTAFDKAVRIGGSVPMIFTNPSGAPELACNECGCCWFDRMSGSCYACGTRVTPEAEDEFRRAVSAHAAARRAAQAPTGGSNAADMS